MARDVNRKGLTVDTSFDSFVGPDCDRDYLWNTLDVYDGTPRASIDTYKMILLMAQYLCREFSRSPSLTTFKTSPGGNLGRVYFDEVSPKRKLRHTIPYVTDTMIKIIDPVHILHDKIVTSGYLTSVDDLAFCEFVWNKMYTRYADLERVRRHYYSFGMALMQITRMAIKIKRTHSAGDNTDLPVPRPVLEMEMERIVGGIDMYTLPTVLGCGGKKRRFDLVRPKLFLQLIMYQLVQCLGTMNRRGFFHNDMGSRNIMVQPWSRILSLANSETMVPGYGTVWLEHVGKKCIKHFGVRAVIVDLDFCSYVSEGLYPYDLYLLKRRKHLFVDYLVRACPRARAEMEKEWSEFEKMMEAVDADSHSVPFGEHLEAIHAIDQTLYTAPSTIYRYIDGYLGRLRKRLRDSGVEFDGLNIFRL